MHEVEFFGVEGVKIAEFGTLEIAKNMGKKWKPIMKIQAVTLFAIWSQIMWKKKKKKKLQTIASRGQNNKFSPAAPGH
jgi:hypothetical protein